MKKLSIYLTMSVMAVLAVACSKNGSQVDPTKPEAAKEANIGFGSASAKAPGALEVNTEKKMQIRVFDFYTKQGADEIKYFDDQIQEATTAGAWAFVSENEYAWKKGTHKFFGWVTKDAAGQDVSGLSFNEETKVLTLSESNTDYQYSTLQTVEWPDATLTDGTVPMTVKHLTSALTYKVTDYNYNGAVTLNSITIKGAQNKASATVDYSGEEAVVNITGPATGDIALGCTADDYTVDTSGEAPVFIGGTTCVWPQDVSGATIEVKYTPNATGSEQKTVTLALPDMTWTAGYRTVLDLQIVNKTIVLTFVVQDWEVVEVGEINTATGSINMSNVTWMNTKFDLNGNGIYGEYITESYVDDDGKEKTRVLLDENTVQMSAYTVMMFPTDGSFDHVVYETYEEDVVDEETGDVIHEAGEIKTYAENVVDEETGDVIHKAGDPIVKEVQTVEYSYQPAQGYFTVNYPVSGLYKIEMIPAYGETEVDPSQYVIMIYDSTTKSWRDYNTAGEPIVHDTVYFRILAAEPQDGIEHKAQIDIWFKPEGEGSDDWISAYSEIRANYAVTIPANS